MLHINPVINNQNLSGKNSAGPLQKDITPPNKNPNIKNELNKIDDF